MGLSPQPWIVPLLSESDLHGELHLVVVDVVDRPAGETLHKKAWKMKGFSKKTSSQVFIPLELFNLKNIN